MYLSKTKRANAQKKRKGKKVEKAHTSTLREKNTLIARQFRGGHSISRGIMNFSAVKNN